MILRFGLLLGLIGAGLCSLAHAQSADARCDVNVVVVSPGAPASALVAQIAAVLESEPLNVSWQTRADLSTETFLQVSFVDPGPPRPGAWIDLRDRNAVRVYFRDAQAQRFFLRSFPPQILDSVLAEQISQVMAPTLAALGDHTKAALTRAQIKTEMTTGKAATPLEAPAAPVVFASASPWGAAPARTTRAVAIETTYAAHWIATQGTAASGPRLRLSSRWNNPLGDVTVWTSVFKPLAFTAQSLSGEDWEMNLWDWRFGLAFCMARTQDVALAVVIGGGADWISARPSVAPNSTEARIVPALRWELRTEMKFATWLYGTFGLSLDVLPPTLLDHIPPAGTPTSLRLATWQPGAWLGLEARTGKF